MTITSSRNPQIKWVRALQANNKERRESQAFVIEGVRLAEEALSAGWEAHLVLCGPDLNPRGQAVAEAYAGRGVRLEQVADHVLQQASDTQTPQGIILVLSMPEIQLPAQADFVFIPDSVRDPGNLGTMMRTAAAAGVQALLVPEGSVDLFAPKVLRAGMGAHFRIAMLSTSWEAAKHYLAQLSLPVFLADAGSGLAYDQADLRPPLALIVGGEAHGAGHQAQDITTARLHIPMPGGSESLNAAAAAAILLFEVVRQRRQGVS